VSTPPTTTGGYYAFGGPALGYYQYLMMGSNYYPYMVNMSTACIPGSGAFNYNMFNIGLIWSSNIPAITIGAKSFPRGDPRLRIVTSYYGENILNNPILNRPSTEWTIVELSDPTNPSTCGISGFVQMPTGITKTLNGTGWDSANINFATFPKTNTSPVPSSGSSVATTYYLTAYSSRNGDATTTKYVYDTSLAQVDLNTSLTTPTIATILIGALSVSTFTTTVNLTGRTHIIYSTNVIPWTTNFNSKIDQNIFFTNILVNTFGQASSTTGVLSSGLNFDTNVYLQLSQPTPDPDPAFTTASENGIIFQPSSPAVTGFQNPVLGITPSTSSFAINSYFSLTPTAATPSFGYFLTYPLNYEEPSPSIEAGSDFLLLTPDSSYIVYVNGSGALATQSSRQLTSPGASPNINFGTYGGYWKATSVASGSPGARGFQLAYVTAATTYYLQYGSASPYTVSVSTSSGSTFTCMHCSPAASGYCRIGL
jgi:hypothetical protein